MANPTATATLNKSTPYTPGETMLLTADHADAVFLDAADTASGSSATLANVFGCLVYSDTVTTPVADQGLCYNYFGTSAGVVAVGYGLLTAEEVALWAGLVATAFALPAANTTTKES